MGKPHRGAYRHSLVDRQVRVTHPSGGNMGGNCRIVGYNAYMMPPMVSHDTQDLPPVLPLTPREKDILICVSEGKSNREIAGQLTIATSTVKWYVRQIYSKLGVDNRVAAIDRAQSLGLLPTGEAVGKIRHNLPAATTPFVGRDVEWLDGANFGRYMARIRWEC